MTLLSSLLRPPLFRGLAAICAVAILYLSLRAPSGSVGMFHADKLHHALAYAGLAGLIGLGWPGRRLWAVVALATLFGIGIEILQGLPGVGRTRSVLDVIANLAGAGLAALFLAVWRRRSR